MNDVKERLKRVALIIALSVALGAVYFFLTHDAVAFVFYTAVWFAVFTIGYKVSAGRRFD